MVRACSVMVADQFATQQKPGRSSVGVSWVELCALSKAQGFGVFQQVDQFCRADQQGGILGAGCESPE